MIITPLTLVFYAIFLIGYWASYITTRCNNLEESLNVGVYVTVVLVIIAIFRVGMAIGCEGGLF